MTEVYILFDYAEHFSELVLTLLLIERQCRTFLAERFSVIIARKGTGILAPDSIHYVAFLLIYKTIIQ